MGRRNVGTIPDTADEYPLRSQLPAPSGGGWGVTLMTLWRSDATAAVAAQGASLPTTLTELDGATGGTRQRLTMEDFAGAGQVQLHVNARVATAVTGSLVTVTVRDLANTANVFATATFTGATVGSYAVQSTWAAKPSWATGERNFGVFMQSSTGTPSVIFKDVTLRWKG